MALPLMAISAIAVALLSFFLSRDTAEMAAGCLFGWILIPLAALDLRHGILPDILTAALFATGLLAAVAVPPHTPAHAILGALAGSGTFLILRQVYFHFRRVEGLGLGDVKLIAGLGVWLGPQWLPLTILIATTTGLALPLISCQYTHRAFSPLTNVSYGACLCSAGLAAWYLKSTVPLS